MGLTVAIVDQTTAVPPPVAVNPCPLSSPHRPQPTVLSYMVHHLCAAADDETPEARTAHIAELESQINALDAPIVATRERQGIATALIDTLATQQSEWTIKVEASTRPSASPTMHASDA